MALPECREGPKTNDFDLQYSVEGEINRISKGVLFFNKRIHSIVGEVIGEQR